MGFRFWRRVKILPGISLNFSGSGVSVSVGPRGAKLTLGPRGTRATVGIPGTGLFYTTRLDPPRYSRHSKKWSDPAESPVSEGSSAPDITTLLTPHPDAGPEEQAFLQGLREVAAGRIDEAARWFDQAGTLVDALFMGALTAIRQKRFQDAANLLEQVRLREAELGTVSGKYGITPTAELPITEEIRAAIRPDTRSLLLVLSETWQHAGNPDRALEYLRMLYRMDPQDPVIRLGIVELLLDARSDHPDIRRKVLELTEGIENASPVHAALLLYRARALRLSGMADAALQTLSQAVRYRRDRPDSLLKAVRYERGLTLESMGKPARARVEFEKLYAEDPAYEDVAARLGMA